MDGNVTFLGDFSKKLVTNTFFNFLGRCWSFVLTLLLTPYILSRLDVGDFGTWVLMTIFISAFNPGQVPLFDLGGVFMKYISEYYTYEDYDSMSRVLICGLFFYGLFGIGLVSIGLLLERPLFQMFHISSAASTAYLLVLLASAISNISAMVLSVFKGIQRMDKSNSLEIRLSILNAAGTVFFLRAGWGILGLASNALLNACIAVAVTCWAVRRAMPEVGLSAGFDSKLLRSMLAYGMKMQVSSVGGIVSFQVPKLIISRFLGTAAVSFYEVASRLTLFMRAVPLVMISALIPATSELRARKDRDRILQTYLLSSKYVAMLTIAMAAFLTVEARALLTLWLGKGFESSVILVQILAIGYAANILGGPASQTGAGIGRPEFDMRGTVLLAILTPVLGLLLVQRFGAAGAAAGTCIAFLAATGYLLVAFHRNYVENSFRTVFEDVYLRPIAAGVFAALAVTGFHQLAPLPAAWEIVRYMIPIKISTDFAIFCPIYMVLLVAFRQVTAIDWKNFLSLVSFGLQFLRHPFRVLSDQN
ncbi:MAG TPA: oligosaccharide flippase family protein [Terriglobia bacterium]|jgi:O-antigen/teichoic acid export membrane protein